VGHGVTDGLVAQLEPTGDRCVGQAACDQVQDLSCALGQERERGRGPRVPTRFVLCSEDRFFPPEFMRQLVTERLNLTSDEIAAGHCVALSRPIDLAEILNGYAAKPDDRFDA
jgi:hypothetical protein